MRVTKTSYTSSIYVGATGTITCISPHDDVYNVKRDDGAGIGWCEECVVIGMHYTAAEQDGPHYSPPRITVEIEVDDRPVITQQTVVMGGAVFGPTTIVMPTKR